MHIQSEKDVETMFHFLPAGFIQSQLCPCLVLPLDFHHKFSISESQSEELKGAIIG